MIDTEDRIEQIPISEIRPFKDHPFKVVDDELMQDTMDSITQVGILTPTIIRPTEDGKYEMVAGHRRLYAAEHLGMKTIPAIVRNLSDEDAVLCMVDTNLQRETISPMERAKAYKMKKDALERKRGRPPKEKEGQVVPNFFGRKTTEIIGDQVGESYKQVQRYIHLTKLIPQMQEMVDNKEIAFSPAVELSYLKPEEQTAFLDAMDFGQATPSLSQAQRIKKLSQSGKCSVENMRTIMNEEKKSELDQITLKSDILRKYFPRSYTPLQMQQTIIRLLEGWQKKQKRDHER